MIYHHYVAHIHICIFISWIRILLLIYLSECKFCFVILKDYSRSVISRSYLVVCCVRISGRN